MQQLARMLLLLLLACFSLACKSKDLSIEDYGASLTDTSGLVNQAALAAALRNATHGDTVVGVRAARGSF